MFNYKSLSLVLFFLVSISAKAYHPTYSLQDICRTYSGNGLENVCQNIPFCSLFKQKAGCEARVGASDTEQRVCESFNQRDDWSQQDKKKVCTGGWGHVCYWESFESSQCVADRDQL